MCVSGQSYSHLRGNDEYSDKNGEVWVTLWGKSFRLSFSTINKTHYIQVPHHMEKVVSFLLAPKVCCCAASEFCSICLPLHVYFRGVAWNMKTSRRNVLNATEVPEVCTKEKLFVQWGHTSKITCQPWELLPVIRLAIILRPTTRQNVKSWRLRLPLPPFVLVVQLTLGRVCSPHPRFLYQRLGCVYDCLRIRTPFVLLVEVRASHSISAGASWSVVRYYDSSVRQRRSQLAALRWTTSPSGVLLFRSESVAFNVWLAGGSKMLT